MNQAAIYTQFSLKKRVLAMIALCLATFMFVLDYTIANVAIPYIAGALSASSTEGTYVITFFAVGNALGLPLTGWLSKRFGMITTLVWAILLFTILSMFCGISQSLLQIIVFRFLQGICAGPIVPLSQNCLRLVFSKEKIGMAMAVFSMIVLTAPVFGPTIGGLLCIKYSWPWIFFINAPIGVFCLVVIRIVLEPLETKKELISLDKFGFLCLFVGSTCLQIMLDKGQDWDWLNSYTIRAMFILTIISFFYLYINCRLKKQPLLNLSLWRYPSYSLSVISIFCIFSLYTATLVMVPFWLQIFMGYNAYLAGLAICPIGFIPVLFSVLIPKFIARVGCLLSMVTGMIGMAVSSFFTMFFTTNVTIEHVALSRLIMGLGILFWVPPIFKLCMSEIRSEDLPMSLGMLHYFRALAAGIGTSMAMTIFNRSMIYHHSNLAAEFTSSNYANQEFINKINAVSTNQLQTNSILEKIVDQQAAMLAFNDVFNFIGIGFIVIAAALLLNYKRVGHFR